MLGKKQARKRKIFAGKAPFLSDLNKMFEAKTEWIWKKHIPKGEPMILNGREGSGKTTICLQMAKEMLREYPDHVIYWLATEGAVKNTAYPCQCNRFNQSPLYDRSKFGWFVSVRLSATRGIWRPWRRFWKQPKNQFWRFLLIASGINRMRG